MRNDLRPMQRAVQILAALFATASLLMFAATVMFVAKAFVDARVGTLPLDNKHLLGDSLIVTAGLVFTGIYGVVAQSLWRRKNWKRTTLFSCLSVFLFPVGSILGIASLILITRPAVRATFHD